MLFTLPRIDNKEKLGQSWTVKTALASLVSSETRALTRQRTARRAPIFNQSNETRRRNPSRFYYLAFCAHTSYCTTRPRSHFLSNQAGIQLQALSAGGGWPSSWNLIHVNKEEIIPPSTFSAVVINGGFHSRCPDKSRREEGKLSCQTPRSA